MKKKFSFILVAILSLLNCSEAFANVVTISVTNNENVQRQEVIEVDAKAVYSQLGISGNSTFVVKNALGQQVGYQLTYDGKLLIDVCVRPCGSAYYTITEGKPETFKTYVTGRQYPERVDDIAWENDVTAYRLYGPALQRSGERAFGIDVWVKNTPELEVEKRYNMELSNSSKIKDLIAEGNKEKAKELEMQTTYHFDHGYGLDCYKVGPTLGCGAPALMIGDSIVMPYCYKSYKILDNGPLRFTVDLTYNPSTIKNDKNVVEHRIISLDKGSHFNKITVWYEGLSKPSDFCSGVVIHKEDTASVALKNNYVCYADPTDNPEKQNFQIYVAALFPNGVSCTKKLMFDKVTNGNSGHALGIVKDLKNNQKYTYYSGSAWSKSDVRTFAEWELRIDEFMNSMQNPLNVTLK
jgi:hypothetical protein